MEESLLHLSAEQFDLLPAYQDLCLQVALATAPADRARAQTGVVSAYEEAGLLPPSQFVWAESPTSAAVTVARLRTAEAKARTVPNVGVEVWNALLDEFVVPIDEVPVGDPVHREIWRDHWFAVLDLKDRVAWSSWQKVLDALGDHVGDWISHDVHQLLWRKAVTRLGIPEDAAVPRTILDVIRPNYSRGQFDAESLVLAKYLKDVGLVESSPSDSALWEVAQACGWWWPFEQTVVLTERPCRIELDERQRPHAEHGPAIEYPDGAGFYRWHGVSVQPEFHLSADEITVEAIDAERSLLLKEAMTMVFGHDRYLAEIGAVLVHEDDFGALYHRLSADGSTVVMVEQFSGSWPDGSPRRLQLLAGAELPLELRSARDAWHLANEPSDERFRQQLAEEVRRARDAGEALPPPGQEAQLMGRRWQREHEERDRRLLRDIEERLNRPAIL